MSAPRRRLTWVVAGVVLTALVLTGATQAAPAYPQLGEAAQFDRAYAAFRAWFVGEHDERGRSYSTWTYRDDTRPGERVSRQAVDYVRVGQGPGLGLFSRDRTAAPGLSLDVLHPPGVNYDLVLVGDRYRQPVPAGTPGVGAGGPLVATPWIARPALAEAAGGWSPCLSRGTVPVCRWSEAWTATRTAVPGLPRLVERRPDGAVVARTGIRLLDLIAAGDGPFNDEQLARLQPLFQTLVPFTITLDGAGRFQRAELNGRLTAGAVAFGVQEGITYEGPAVDTDLPRSPSDTPGQVTVMDELRYLHFAGDAAARATDLTPG